MLTLVHVEARTQAGKSSATVASAVCQDHPLTAIPSPGLHAAGHERLSRCLG
jgi:hypothetical protein